MKTTYFRLVFILTCLFFVSVSNVKASELENFFRQERFFFSDYINFLEGVDEKIIEELEVEESAEKQFELGFIYKYHRDFADLQKAESVLKKSARQRYAPAQMLLGLIYKEGGNKSRAFSLFKKSEKKGDPHAAYELAQLYEYGGAIIIDKTKAIDLYEKAKEKEILAAYAKMSNFYISGDNYEPDYEKAIETLRFLLTKIDKKSLETNVALRIAALYDVILSTKGVNAEDEDNARYEQEKFAMHLIAARNGDTNSMLLTAKSYAEGIGVDIDYEQVLIWYEKAASKGNPAAMEWLGHIYANKLYGNKRDYKKAAEWYKKAAYKRSKTAAWNLGYFYYYGYGVEKDLEKAKYWFGISGRGRR